MDRGINCLLEKLGVVETERFISVINREKFDYIEWQRQRFDNMSSDEFNEVAVAYSKEYPFHKKTITFYVDMGIHFRYDREEGIDVIKIRRKEYERDRI